MFIPLIINNHLNRMREENKKENKEDNIKYNDKIITTIAGTFIERTESDGKKHTYRLNF